MFEIIVIGAGLAGFAVALALWERDAAVTLVETSRPGAEATGASAGMLAAQYESTAHDAKFRLGLESRRRYPAFARKLEELTGQSLDLRWDGILVANQSEDEHENAAAMVRWQQEAELSAELMAPEEAARLEAGINPGVPSYVWLPDEGHLDSQKLAEALGAALARTGIRLIVGNQVARLESKNGAVTGVVMRDGRNLEGERVVVAAGAWSGTLVGLPRSIPVRPMRGQILRFQPSGWSLGRVVASHAGRYVVPRADGTLLAGSTMEDVGFDRSITDPGRLVIHEAVAGLVPALAGARPIEHWAGLRPISVDRCPILGPDPDLEGLYYATGYGRDGVLLAPLAGEIVAELILAGKSAFDWRSFRADRFDT